MRRSLRTHKADSDASAGLPFPAARKFLWILKGPESPVFPRRNRFGQEGRNIMKILKIYIKNAVFTVDNGNPYSIIIYRI